MTQQSRLNDLTRFYKVLESLGTPKLLAELDQSYVPKSGGVYFFFELGEERSESGNGSRVVRIGSSDNLQRRLGYHFGRGASSFRDNLGKALVCRDGLGADAKWRVHEVIRSMSFVWLETDDVRLQALIEKESIALLSNYRKPPLDPPSANWLGHHGHRVAISRSGLWNIQHGGGSHRRSTLMRLERLAAQMRK